MLRRSFLQSIAAIYTAGCVTKANATDVVIASTDTEAATRIGKHILSTCSNDDISMLRQVSKSLPSISSSELNSIVASEHRIGHIIKVDRIHFSVTEAAWFVLLAEFEA